MSVPWWLSAIFYVQTFVLGFFVGGIWTVRNIRQRVAVEMRILERDRHTDAAKTPKENG